MKEIAEGGWFDISEREMIRFLEKIYGTLSENSKLCAVFTSLFLKAGHVCLPVDKSPKEWAEILELDQAVIKQLPEEPFLPGVLSQSAIVGELAEQKPFVLEGSCLQFHRYRSYEDMLVRWMDQRNRGVVPEFSKERAGKIIAELFPGQSEEIDWQKTAAVLSLIRPFLIISGGPGTGKTTTVARILALHQKLAGRKLNIALAAPTGKAAGRMGEALQKELDKMNLSEEEKGALPKEAKTVHRLLSATRQRGLLPPAEKKLLRHDLIIVDEASMIDLNLMHRLVSHLSDKTRLILLGDRDQLASVEAGAVFADLCQKEDNRFSSETLRYLEEMTNESAIPLLEDSGLNDSIVYLTKSYRFTKESGIGRLAAAVKAQDCDRSTLEELFDQYDDLEYHAFSYSSENVKSIVSRLIEQVKHVSKISDPHKLLQYWKQMIWLVVLRRGLEGADHLNQMAEQVIALSRTVRMEEGWYHGRPVMITQNDYNLGVFNGDMGVCVKDPAGNHYVYIESGSELKRIQAKRLTHFTPAYFLTVHKSQGSEFNRINLLLPQRETPILTRELIYTAITRARESFALYGDLDRFISGIRKKTQRFSGLGKKIG
ncbi:MAG: exodeoxyribonuclease V subunit alpha [Balneolaceae bacterium]|nr:MAG: exodeoxyribonuclease V subunit alpha [Balneolaceae bacterium]